MEEMDEFESSMKKPPQSLKPLHQNSLPVMPLRFEPRNEHEIIPLEATMPTKDKLTGTAQFKQTEEVQNLEKQPSNDVVGDFDQEQREKAQKHVKDNSINARNVLFKKEMTEEEKYSKKVKQHKLSKKKKAGQNPMEKMTQVTVIGRNDQGQLGFKVSNHIENQEESQVLDSDNQWI